MGYEIVVAAIASGILSIIGILVWQHGNWKKMEMELEHKQKMTKLKGVEYRRNAKYKKQLNPPSVDINPPRNLIDLAKGVDYNLVKGVLKAAQLGEEDDEEEDEESDDLVTGFVKNNPELVQGLLDGIMKKKPGDNQSGY